jgi:hypothetical protein
MTRNIPQFNLAGDYDLDRLEFEPIFEVRDGQCLKLPFNIACGLETNMTGS